jgi:[ribosomal protein S18]-alanine N-acetyltransferase
VSQFRPIRWWDIPALVELEAELFGLDAWSAATWWGELAQQPIGRQYLAAGPRSGQITGFIGLQAAGPEAEIMTLGVVPAARGQGLGRALLGAAIARASEAGSTALLLEVRADNNPARQLYSTFGFERIAVRRGYYRNARGEVDAYVLRLRPLVSGS